MLNPDVTEILDDPDVGGGVSFTVIRKTTTRVRGGVSVVEEEFHPTGNIQPVSKGMNQNQPEDLLDEQIVIRSTFIFQNGDSSHQTDEVIWNGIRWRVTSIDNWAEWGFNTAYATRVRE